jgi:hypothetical protein
MSARTVINEILKISGLKIMFPLILGNLAIEFAYASLIFLKKNKFKVLHCLRFIVQHLSITNIINKKARKVDVFCVIIVYILFSSGW